MDAQEMCCFCCNMENVYHVYNADEHGTKKGSKLFKCVEKSGYCTR